MASSFSSLIYCCFSVELILVKLDANQAVINSITPWSVTEWLPLKLVRGFHVELHT